MVLQICRNGMVGKCQARSNGDASGFRKLFLICLGTGNMTREGNCRYVRIGQIAHNAESYLRGIENTLTRVRHVATSVSVAAVTKSIRSRRQSPPLNTQVKALWVYLDKVHNKEHVSNSTDLIDLKRRLKDMLRTALFSEVPSKIC